MLAREEPLLAPFGVVEARAARDSEQGVRGEGSYERREMVRRQRHVRVELHHEVDVVGHRLETRVEGPHDRPAACHARRDRKIDDGDPVVAAREVACDLGCGVDRAVLDDDPGGRGDRLRRERRCEALEPLLLVAGGRDRRVSHRPDAATSERSSCPADVNRSSQTSSITTARRICAYARLACPELRHEGADLRLVEKIREAVALDDPVRERPGEAPLEPRSGRSPEERHLRAVDDLGGKPTATQLTENPLLLAEPDLRSVWEPRRPLDEDVVEIRHADLERDGHRHAVEVVEHVVDECELGVEVERGVERRRVGGQGRRDPVDGPPRGEPVERAQARAAQPTQDRVVDSRAHRQKTLGRRPRGGRAQQAPNVPPGRDGAKWPACRSGQARQVDHARSEVLAVAAEQLVGALAGQGDGHT